jgi:hypothetical protein
MTREVNDRTDAMLFDDGCIMEVLASTRLIFPSAVGNPLSICNWLILPPFDSLHKGFMQEFVK